jgi:hypothetical protein
MNHAEGLRTIELVTRDGARVTRAKILPYEGELPAVVLWGSRIFTRDALADTPAGPCYREAFATVVLGAIAE